MSLMNKEANTPAGGAVEAVSAKARTVKLQDENDLLKAALVESKQAFAEQAKKQAEQIAQLSKQVQALVAAVDESNKAAGTNIQKALKEGCEGALDTLQDKVAGNMLVLENFNDELKGKLAKTWVFGWCWNLSFLAFCGIFAAAVAWHWGDFGKILAKLDAINNALWVLLHAQGLA